MRHLLAKVTNHRVIAHLLAANDRYNKRLGPQFAAAITYFSVLSLVPILMFAFAVMGWTVSVLRPELMDTITGTIRAMFGDENTTGDSISTAIQYALNKWNEVGILAVLTAGYSGSNWVGNLKRAVRVMWCRKFAEAVEKKHILLETALNLATFVGLIGSIALGAAVTQLGSSFSELILDHLGWRHVPGIGIFWFVLTTVLVLVASWLLMAFLFVVLPNQTVRPRAWLVGTLMGALGLTALQAVAGRLFGLFSGNTAVAIFGPIIVLMLVFNVLATLILMTAAWVGTDEVWAEERAKRLAETSPIEMSEVDVDEPSHPERWAATRPLDELRDPESVTLPEPRKDRYVRQDIAIRGARAGWYLGYGAGAAAGAGLGAALVAAKRWALSRRK